jgi:hypothetical protein
VTDRFLNDMRCFRGGLTLGVHKIPFRVFSSYLLELSLSVAEVGRDHGYREVLRCDIAEVTKGIPHVPA